MPGSILRALGYLISTAFSAACVAGIAGLIWLSFAPDVTALFEEPASVSADDPDEERLGALFEEVTSITFFINRPLEGTAHGVTTGAAFASAADVGAGEPLQMWCYVALDEGDMRRHLTLGNRDGAAEPVFVDLAALSPDTFDAIGLNRTALEAAARENCVFDGFDPRDARS